MWRRRGRGPFNSKKRSLQIRTQLRDVRDVRTFFNQCDNKSSGLATSVIVVDQLKYLSLHPGIFDNPVKINVEFTSEDAAEIVAIEMVDNEFVQARKTCG